MYEHHQPHSTRGRILEAAPLVLFLTLLVGTVWRDGTYLMQHPVAVGVDGYYYVIQVANLLGEGRLYFPTGTPLILYALAGLSYFIGDAVLAVKVGSVLLHGLLCAGVFALIATAVCSRWLGMLGGALVAFSGLHFHLLSEFINNLGAVFFLVWGAWCTVKAAQSRRVIWAAPAALCFVAAAFSHKSVLLLAPLLAVLTFLVRQLLAPQAHGRYRLAALLLFGLLLFAPLVIATQPIITVPESLKSELAVRPQLPFGRVALAEKLILLIAVPATLFLTSRLPESMRGSAAAHLFCVVAALSLLITLNPFLKHTLGWTGTFVRLSGLAYIQVAILVPGLIWLSLRIRRAAAWYAAALVAPLFALSVNAELPSGMQPHYLFNRAQIIEQLPRRRAELGATPLVLAEHGSQFVVTSASGIPSQQRLPQDSTGKTIYWLLFGVKPQMLRPSMITLARGMRGTLTVLVKGDDLQREVTTMSEADRRHLFMVNRHLSEACRSAGRGDASGGCFQVP